MQISKLLVKFFLLLAALLVVIPCLQKGMFLDGINYANVANNLANGKGSLWHFTYSETFLNHYTHQLPFMLWCEALFYYVLGDSTMVERVFCLVLLILNSFAITKLWSVSFPEHRQYFGLPLVLWIITPIVFWGFTNNVQEIMMSLCAVVSVTFIFQYYENSNKTNLLLGGLFCFLCGFCKGLQGLFPLVAVPLYHFIVQRKKLANAFKDLLWFTLPVILCSFILWIYDPARQMLVDNFQDRLKSTFITEFQNTTGYRFKLWFDLLMELLVPIGLCVFIYLLFKLKSNKIHLAWQKRSLFFLFIGLSASLPLIVTLEQRRFYLITCIPFFAIAFAGIFIPLIQGQKVNKNIYKTLNFMIIGGTVLALLYATVKHGSYKRDELLLADVNAIGEIVSKQTICADPELMFHYSLVAYLARIHNVSLDFERKENCIYHISQKNDANINYKYIGNSYHLEINALE